jgi:hypothetical protein
MAIQWGNWVQGHRIQSRLGIDIVGNLTGGMPVKAVIYVQTTGWFSDAFNHVRVTGAHQFENKNFRIGAGGPGVVKITEVAANYPPQFGKSQAFATGASITGFIGGDCSVIANWVVPAIQYYTPIPVSDVKATRTSDRIMQVTWQNNGSSLQDARPYLGIDIYRRTDDVQRYVDTIGGDQVAWTDTGVEPGHTYQYEIRAKNNAGEAAGAVSNYAFTTPLPPTGVHASRSGDGATIIVTWGIDRIDRNAKIVIADQNGAEVQYPADARRVEFAVGQIDRPRQYDVRVTIGGLASPRVTSNPIVVASAPNAPTIIAPDGVYLRSNPSSIRFSWQHNPTDYSDQSKYLIEFTRGDTWEPKDVWNVTQETSVNYVSVVQWPDAQKAAGRIQWRLRTWGWKKGDDFASPWSYGSFYLADPPTFDIVNPSAGATVDSDETELTLGSFSEAGAYKVVVDLVDDSGQDKPHRIETSIDVGTKDSWVSIPLTGLKNGRHYTVTTTITGLVESDPKTVKFNVEYKIPPVPVVKTEWDPESGIATFRIDYNYKGPEDKPVKAAIFKLMGSNFANRVKVADGTPDSLPMWIDRFPNGNSGSNRYWFWVESKLGKRAWAIVDLDTSKNPLRSIVFTSKNDNAVFRWNPEVSKSIGSVNKETHYFAGRRLPVAFVGIQDFKTVDIGFDVLEDDKRGLDLLTHIARASEQFLYRDPSGEYMWCMVREFKTSYSRQGRIWHVTLTATEVEAPNDGTY